MTVQNLDAACATLGAKLGSSGNKDTENSITKDVSYTHLTLPTNREV